MKYKLIPLCLILSVASLYMAAQNPLITDQFTADPSARVFEGKVYVYPSHDVPCDSGRGFIGFCMPDYHVFSSEDLTEWTDHGVIISQERVEWVDPDRYSLWAPDCIEKDGRYYFYFPAVGKDTALHRGMHIGVAVADKPYGPFIPEAVPMEKIRGIDPNPFIDKDGQGYIYLAGRGSLFVAKLSPDMRSIEGEPVPIEGLPKGFKEGPYLFEREGIYYFTYPFVRRRTEELVYAVGDNPMGPFEYKGRIMKESPTRCWTNHHSILEYQGQWYLFYHHNDLSPEFDKNRSIRADSLFFNKDGTIREVIPTWRGVGISYAEEPIHIDRYSAARKRGISLNFVDDSRRHLGWYVSFERKNAWIRYNRVDFSHQPFRCVKVRLKASSEGSLVIRTHDIKGPVLAVMDFISSGDWMVREAPLLRPAEGIGDLVISLKDGEDVQVDWIVFE